MPGHQCPTIPAFSALPRCEMVVGFPLFKDCLESDLLSAFLRHSREASIIHPPGRDLIQGSHASQASLTLAPLSTTKHCGIHSISFITLKSLTLTYLQANFLFNTRTIVPSHHHILVACKVFWPKRTTFLYLLRIDRPF